MIGFSFSPTQWRWYFLLCIEIDLYSRNLIFLSFFLLDGGPKYTRNQQLQYHATNGIVNPALQTSLDHLSTLSRPRSTEAIQSNGSLANGRYTNGAVSRGSNGLHEDLDFPTTPRTLSRKKNIIWMRPHVSIFQLIACSWFAFYWIMQFVGCTTSLVFTHKNVESWEGVNVTFILFSC